MNQDETWRGNKAEKRINPNATKGINVIVVGGREKGSDDVP